MSKYILKDEKSGAYLTSSRFAKQSIFSAKKSALEFDTKGDANAARKTFKFPLKLEKI